MIDKLVRTLIRNRVLVIILILAIIVAGYVCYYNIPKKENPSVTFPGYFVTTIYPGASPDEVDQFVTSKVEDAILDEFDNLQYVQSTSINSASVVIVLYDFDVQKSEVESPLRTAVDSVQSSLPSMCYESTVTAIMVENTQFIIALSGEHYSSDDLVSYAQTIQKKLENVQGVTSVEIVGERTKQVNVKCDPDKLLLYGINIENILNLLLAQNVSIPSGTIDYESGTITVNTPSVFESLKDIENVVVSASEESLAFVRLKDVASVSIDYADSYYYRQDGIETVLLVGCFEDGLNAVNIGKKVREEIEQIKLELPSDLSFHEVMYSPEDVDNNIKGFMLNMLESVILIMIVVMIGVKLRNGIVISVSIPLSIFATFIVMYVLDIEFQFISIAALIISLGILVDNSIVISEAVQQHLNRGEEREDAIVAAVREVYRSVLTSTLTTFATFGVLYFIPGTIGLVVSTIPTVVISALTASYLISMLLVPVLAYMFFQPESEIRIQKESIVEKSIIKILDTALKHKGITIAVAFSTLIIAVLLVTSLGIKFFPGSTKPVIYINVVSESTSLSKTDRIVREIEEYLDASELVDNYTSGIGADLPSFFMTVASRATGENTAQIMIQLNEAELKKQYGGSTEELTRVMQQEINRLISGAECTVKYLEYSIPTEAPVTINVEGDDLETVQRVARMVEEKLRMVQGTDNVRDTITVSEYEYLISVDSDVLMSYGLLKYDVVKQINTSLMGAVAATYVSGGKEMDIVVSCDIASLDELLNIPITSSVTGYTVQLRQVADVRLNIASPVINRYNGKYYVSVLSNVLTGYSAFGIETDLNRLLEGEDLEGCVLESKGEFTNMMELIGNLGVTGSIAVFVIFIIIYLQFKSFKKPLIVITSIPLSLIGCGLGLWLFRMQLQAMAILGAVSLFGIVVNNGIILMEFIDIGVGEGLSVEDACRQAIRMRYRAIMMTSITTCIGLVPLIIANDPMTAPMASVLMFGLLASTILTMIVVPTLYCAIHRDKNSAEGPCEDDDDIDDIEGELA